MAIFQPQTKSKKSHINKLHLNKMNIKSWNYELGLPLDGLGRSDIGSYVRL